MYLKILFWGGVLATCLMDSLFAGRPGCIDCHPDVVDGLPFLPFRNEGKEGDVASQGFHLIYIYR